MGAEPGKSNQKADRTEGKAGTVKKRAKGMGIRKITYIMLGATFIYFFWYVLSERVTPYTEQARIDGLVNPIVPRVNGYLTKSHVKLHSRVNIGDTLFQLDRRPFVLAVKSAEANLDNTAQMVSARTSSVKSAAGSLGVARAQLDRAQRNYDRVQQIIEQNPGALSLYDRDLAETQLSQATEQVASAEAELEKSQQALGTSGPENARFRAALVALEKAQLDLAFSTIIAPAPGFIESLNVDLGYYTQPGDAIATLVSSNDVWIRADMKENNISNIEVGEEVEYILDIQPGKVYKGQVESIGYGIKFNSDGRGELPSVKGQTGWLREPQRFPVIISFDINEPGMDKIRLGAQVDVVAYSGDSWFLNTIARIRIRINSWLSYLR